MISTMKMESKEVHSNFEALTKSVRMLHFGTQDMDNILKNGKMGIDKKGLGFVDKGEQEFIQGCSTLCLFELEKIKIKYKFTQHLQQSMLLNPSVLRKI